MNSELLKGSAVLIVLTHLSKREMHGYELLKTIEKDSEGAFSYKEGTLYPLLHQLEKQGSVEARWEQTESARKRRFYRITREGKKLLKEKKNQWIALKIAIDHLTGRLSEK
jgi:PadR family transcriptional regulator, regulatory protein PadR